MIYLQLFLEFFKTGLFAVGGGLATIPFLKEMELAHPEWFNEITVADIVAVAESTPGPIGVNAATYCGYSAAGVLGAITATLSLITPSIIIISIIAAGYKKVKDSRVLTSTFSCIRPAVSGLIFASGLSVLLAAIKRFDLPGIQAYDWVCLVIFAVFFGLQQLKIAKKIHPIFFILLGAGVGILLGL